jgi:hypothetical protein
MLRVSRPTPTIQAPSGASASVEGDQILVRDAAGVVVVRFDGATGEARVEAGRDLVLAAPRGSVRLEAKKDVTLKSERRVHVTAPTLELTAGVLETHARRLLSRLGDVYREIDGLLSTRAARSRTVVEGDYEVLAGRASIASDGDTSIDGKRVLLG